MRISVSGLRAAAPRFVWFSITCGMQTAACWRKRRMSSAELARQFANAQPGYDLVSYREVALPLFRVELEVLVLEEKPIPPIQEFVLRAVGADMPDISTIAGVLGLEE